MTSAIDTLIKNCINGITANKEHCLDLVEHSAGIATALCPVLGYKKSAEIAKRSLKTGESIRKIVLKEKLISPRELDSILDLEAMSKPDSDIKAAM